MKKLLLALGLAAFAVSGWALNWAWATDTYTAIGNANYTVLASDYKLRVTASPTANRTITMISAGATNIGLSLQGGGNPPGIYSLEIIDDLGLVGGSNSCYLIAPASGETINNSSSNFTFCTTYGVLSLRPMSGSSWSAQIGSTSPGQLPGTSTNDNANAGNVGEVATTNVPLASAVQITTNSALQIASLSLTAGDWDCRGTLSESVSATTTVSQLSASIGTSNSVFGTQGTDSTNVFNFAPVSATLYGPKGVDLKLGPVRESFAATTTVYLVGGATFATSQLWGFGSVTCRRAR